MSRVLVITRFAREAIRDVFPAASRAQVLESPGLVRFEDGSLIRYVSCRNFDELVDATRGTTWDAVIADVNLTIQRLPEFQQLLRDLTK